MPLSEHEQRLLDQIERALYQEDPKFASTVRQTDLRTHMRRRLRRAALLLAVGFGLLLAGVVSSQWVVGVAGFVVMVGALLLAMTSWKRLGQGAGTGTASEQGLRAVGSEERPARSSKPGRSAKPTRGSKPARPSGGGSLTARLEERWRRRWEERGGGR